MFWSKNSWDICVQFLRYLCACRNQLFFDFSKYLRNYKEYSKSQWLFQVLLSTIFYKTFGTFNETFLTLSSITCNIFSKRAAFCVVINLIFKKVVTSSRASFARSKNKQNSKPARLITHLQDTSSITGTLEISRTSFLQKFPEHTFQ